MFGIEIRTEKLLDELGETLLLEDTDTNLYTLSENPTGGAIVVEDGAYQVGSSRPLEGDLIYFPLVKKIFEIRFVEHEVVFYQTGKLQTFELTCELWEYSSERLETDVDKIDDLANDRSLDVLSNELFADGGISYEADNSPVELESEDGNVSLETYRIENVEPQANNEHLTEGTSTVLDLSETNPFSFN